VDGLHRLHLDREQVLNRLWEIANLSPEMTRNSLTGQVKALSMIVAMLDLIPNRRAASAQKEPAPASAPQIHTAAWLRRHKAVTIDPQPSPAPQGQEGEPAPSSAADTPPNPHPSHSTFAKRLTPSEAPSLPLHVPLFTSIPDLGVALPIKNPFIDPAKPQMLKRT
jgi:hypothetical protein